MDAAVAPADAAASPAVPLATLLGHLPRVEVSEDVAARVANGISIDDQDGEPGDVSLICEGRLVAVGEREAGRVRPRVVLEGAADRAVLRA